MLNRNFHVLFFCLICISVQGQMKVKGTVFDAVSKDPLIGVTILEKGTNNGTATDIDGSYELKVSDKNATLEFNYIGYSKELVKVDGKRKIDVLMAEDFEELEEVVVVGYGVQKKSVVTGAISKVKASQLEHMPVNRIEESLLGRTSGVRVTMNSGQPGEAGTVRIRGTTSINNSDPLYVVDGVPIGGGIDFLNQSDIESIEVLKDAASASIYGARAANGVILVTTKQGLRDTTIISYNAYYGLQSPWKKLSVLNATEYATLMNEASVAAGRGILFDDPAALGEGTDWQDALFTNDSPIQNHELSISTGGKKSKYYASFGLFDHKGMIAPEQSNYQRFTARFNSTHQINPKIKIGNTIAYARIKSEGISTNSEFGSPVGRAINIDPLTPIIETDEDVLNSDVFKNFQVVRNENGQPYGISELVTSEIVNPLAALEIQQDFGWSDKVVANLFAEFELLEGLKFRTSGGIDLAFWGGEGFTPLFYLNATNNNDLTNYNRSQNRGLKYILSNTLTYDKEIGSHDFGLLLGTVAEQNSGQGIGGNVKDLPVNSLEEASLAFSTPSDNQDFFGFEYIDRLASYIGRVNYNFGEKYILSASLRVDGSSKFGANNKFGFFPSASVGWVVTEEDFLRNHSQINFLKLRGSWGVNGSNNIGDFLFVSTVGGGRNFTFGLDEQLVNGVSPNAIANPDLRWEETTQTNFGFDAKIFKNLEVTFDVFEKLTTGMLLGIAVPSYVGNGGPIGNIASMQNQGVELELNYKLKERLWSLEVGGNVSYIENKVTDLGPEQDFLVGQTFSPQGLQITRISEGLPIGYLFGHTTDGIFQNQAEVDSYVNSDGTPIQPNAAPGDFRFVDLNEDGVIDDDDRGMIGDPTPRWTYGLNLNAKYLGFELLVFGQGVAGNDVFKATRRFDLEMANLTGDALDRWTGEGSTNDYPRLIMGDPNQNFSRSSNFYIEDGSFFRIRTLQLAYNLPTNLIERVGLSKFRVYVSGNNLFTFTKYSGFDPEIGGGSFGVDRGLYPQARFYTVGLNVSF